MAVKGTFHAPAASAPEKGSLCVEGLAHPEITLDQPIEVTASQLLSNFSNAIYRVDEIDLGGTNNACT
jgi:hypothetical protein